MKAFADLVDWEIHAPTTSKNEGGMSAEMHGKVVEDDPRAFYGLN